MWRRMIGRLRSLAGWKRLDVDIDRELHSHIAMETAHRQKLGLGADEARRTALRDFGGVVKIREDVRDARGMTMWDTCVQDMRFGLRMLRRAPGYTAAAVLILALGIGANTAIFSVINGVLLKPLPFRSGDEIVLVQQSAPASNLATTGVSIFELFDYRTRVRSIRDLVEYHQMSFTLLNQGDPDRVDTAVVSSNFFEMLGVRPLHGRAFVDKDDDLGADAVLMLSYGYWKQKFGGDPQVIGRVLEMNNRPHTVVGVLPDYPQYPASNDVYMPTSACPFRAQAEAGRASHRAFAALQVFGRLASGATLAQASAELAVIATAFTQEFAQDYTRARGFSAEAASLREQLVQGARPMLLALGGATMLVLLIACANVANLSLGRTLRRQRELAVRTALGADRARLVRQLVTENLIVAIAGGVVGLTLAWLSQDVLVTFVGRFTARTSQIGIDGGVLLFTLLASILTGLVFGVAPAMAGRRNPMQSIRDGAAQAGESRVRQRVRAALVVAQVAVSFVLLVGAALLLESFYRLSSVPVGYETNKVMTAAIFGNFTRNATAAQTVQLNTRILERLRSSPGVVSAAVTNAVPFTNLNPQRQSIRLEGRTTPEGTALLVNPNTASPGYFETLSVPVLSGRTFRESDTADAPIVAVINQQMAQLWNGADPVGSRFVVDGPVPPGAPPRPWITVAGVVSDFRLYNVDQPVEPQYYVSYLQSGGFGGRLLVRTTGSAADLIPTITAAVHAVDAQIPVEELLTLEELREGRLRSPELTAALLTVFAVVALVITVAGLAGIIATSVSQRTREFGLRMALGASRASVLQLVLRQGVWLVAAGLALGVGGAWAFSQLIRRYLFATETTDVSAYVTVAVVFLIAALVAAIGPARRATTIDPLIALKAE